ncbi:prepilin peptidase [Ideonella sp. BN130291]|uniref:prepilin peptidase n=1 Tax=Ideonella sp. BN130291 TaxID=3112940 RepID=UPI002E252242|nr:A24 family peptidase [Ideonella sp. BN130291]
MSGSVPSDVWLSIPVLALLGLCVGSFLNVVIHRLPLMLERQWWQDVAHQLADLESWRRVFGSKAKPAAELQRSSEALSGAITALPRLGLAKPASRCPACGHQIKWHENIPLLSWLRLKGRCSACGARISARYPLVELLTAALFAGVAWRFGPQPATLLWCGVVAVLVALAGIDWDTTVLPDLLTLPLLWAGLIASALGWVALPLPAALWGAVAGYLSLWSVYWLFKLTTGKEGMGFGDFKLMGALGAWLGWQMIVPILLGASIIGAVVGIAMKMNQSLREGRYVPFGPFLAGAGIAVLLLGEPRVLGWLGW